MPNWNHIVREHLAVPPEREIVEEQALHFKAACRSNFCLLSRLIISRRMLADKQQKLPLIDHAFPVQIQLRDRSAANRGQADHNCVVIAPGKMLMPIVFSRVKKRDRFTCYRVNRLYLVVLEIVASLASPREVLLVAFASSGKRDDVLVRERIRAVSFLANAVLAAALRAFSNHKRSFLGIRPLVMRRGFDAQLLHQFVERNVAQAREFYQASQPLDADSFGLIRELDQFLKFRRGNEMGLAFIYQLIHSIARSGRKILIDFEQKPGFRFR
jgi:hypothetical protein